MKSVKLFEKYYKRIARESMTKAVICGLIVGCAAMFITAFLCWFFIPKLFWLAFIALAVGAGVSAPLFYRYKFKPTSSAVATRIDELGLEERMITMNEYMGDDSYIAERQRDDAIKTLGTISADLIKVVVSIPLVIAACFAVTLGAGMTTVGGLANAGVIGGGKDLIDDLTKEEPVYYDVEYDTQGDGEIVGDIVQRIEKGKDATEIYAVAGDGYVFSCWLIKGQKEAGEPYRQDTKIDEDMKVIAVFEPANGDGEGDGEGEGEGGEQGDSEKPNDGEGKAEGSDGNNSNNTGTSPGGSYVSNDQVIDGKQDYKDHYDAAREEATENARDNGNLTDEDKDAIDGYFNIIKK